MAGQVRKMDLVYQSAELIIVAAGGDDPSHSLPRVCERKNVFYNLTTCAKIRERFLISLSPHLSLCK